MTTDDGAPDTGCTIISGHTYVRNHSRQYIMSASIVFRNQEDIALVDMLAEHSVLPDSISYLAVPRT